MTPLGLLLWKHQCFCCSCPDAAAGSTGADVGCFLCHHCRWELDEYVFTYYEWIFLEYMLLLTTSFWVKLCHRVCLVDPRSQCSREAWKVNLASHLEKHRLLRWGVSQIKRSDCCFPAGPQVWERQTETEREGERKEEREREVNILKISEIFLPAFQAFHCPTTSFHSSCSFNLVPPFQKFCKYIETSNPLTLLLTHSPLSILAPFLVGLDAMGSSWQPLPCKHASLPCWCFPLSYSGGKIPIRDKPIHCPTP